MGRIFGKKLAVVAFVASLLLYWSCSSIDCNLEGKVQCHYVIQSTDGAEVQLNYPLSVILMRSNAKAEDTVYIYQQSNASKFDVPMSYSSDTDRLVLSMKISYSEMEDTIEVTKEFYLNDTISISKTNEPLFESVDCAPRYNHTITGVDFTRNFISDVVINNEKVRNDASVKNIFIRVRPYSK